MLKKIIEEVINYMVMKWQNNVVTVDYAHRQKCNFASAG